MTVKLFCRSIFTDSNKFRSHTSGAGYVAEQTTTMHNCANVGVQLSVRFGSFKGSVRKTGTSISNDDLVGRKQGD